MRSLLLALALLCALAAPALAHKLKVFASADGSEVRGHVYVPGGERVAGAAVSVAVGDDVVARVTSGPDGGFAFTPEARTDHRITAEIDGHQGVWMVRADELPPALPAPEGMAAPGPATVVDPAVAVPSTPQLEAMVEQAVARQVAPLRSEIQEWREAARWRDVAGGLGWIVGLAGLIAWASGRRR